MTLAFCVSIVSFATHTKAQTGRILHSVSTLNQVPPQLGREFWFSPVPISSDPSRTYTLYVTATKKTTVQIAVPGTSVKQLTLLAYKTATYSIPSYTDTSAKAIHVWDTAADLCCNLVSHSTGSGDGMYIPPTIGWGSDYVVAAYNAFYRNSSSGDFPCEFNIVSDLDNTLVTITPTAANRGPKDGSGNYTVAHAKNIPFTVMVNAGDVVQFKTMPATDSINFDFTGTVVSASASIGVAAGSQQPGIPMSFDAPDHVCEMMAPVRTWGTTYFSAPFVLPGLKARSTFLMIGTVPNQTISRMDSTGTYNLVTTLAKPYDHAWTSKVEAPSRWESSDPFWIVQYINSSTYAGASNTSGDPAELILEASALWLDTVVFQTPGLTGYTEYVNLIVNSSAVNSTTIDSRQISTYPSLTVDPSHSMYRITGLTGGTHIVTSSSPVGVTCYGYGTGESFAMTGFMPTATFGSLDGTPPIVRPSGLCFEDRIDIVDSGISGSALDYIRLDTLWNMTYGRDGNWVDGGGLSGGYYTMHVKDSTREAYMQASAFDFAGNRATIVSTFEPRLATIRPVSQDFGYVDVASSTPIVRFDTLRNIGTTPFPFTILRLYGGDTSGFSIVSPDTSPLAPGETRTFQVMLIPKLAKLYWAGIQFGDTCILQSAVMRATGSTGDFHLTNFDFGTVQVGNAVESPSSGTLGVKAVNTSDAALVTIDSIWADSSAFLVENTISSQNPLVLQHGETTYLNVRYTPSLCSFQLSGIHARSREAGRKDAVLSGTGACADVAIDYSVLEPARLLELDGGRFLRASIPSSWSSPVHLEIEDILGHRVLSMTVDSMTKIDASTLPRGVYFYRLSSNAAKSEGKVVIGE